MVRSINMAAAATLALAATLCSVALTETVPSDIIGVYERVSVSDEFMDTSACPATMRFSAYEFDQSPPVEFKSSLNFFNILIPKRSTKLGSTSCGSSGSIVAVEADHPNAVKDRDELLNEFASLHGSLDDDEASSLATSSFLRAARNYAFILGYDYTERVCGGGDDFIPAGTTYLWFEPQGDITYDDDNNVELDKGTKYLLTVTTGAEASAGCIYEADEIMGDGPTSDPSRKKGFKYGAKKKDDEPEETTEAEEEEEEEEEDDEFDDSDETGSVFGDSSRDDEINSEPRCFPESATVTLADGRSIPMHELSEGDSVIVGPNGAVSKVVMFTHRDTTVESEFVTLHTARSDVFVTCSSGHYVYVNGDLVAAASAKAGDFLTLADGTTAAITAVSVETARGLYNPQTAHGDIVVNGVVASTYTTAVAPAFAHGLLLAPVRALCHAGVCDLFEGIMANGADKLARWMPSGIATVSA